MFRTTIKGLLGHKLRVLSTMVAIVIGVSFMSGTLVFTDTIGKTFDDLFASVIKGDAFVRSTITVKSQGPGQVQRGLVDESLLERVRQVDGVRAAEGNVAGYAQLVDKKGKAIGNPGQGAPTFGFNWSDTPELNSFTVFEGERPRGEDQVAIDKASAEKGPFVVGDRIRVLTKTGSIEKTVSGIVRFGEADSPLGASVTLFDTATAQKTVGVPGKFSDIVALARPGTSQQEVTSRLQQLVPADTEAVTGDAYVKEQQQSSRDSFSFFTAFLLTFAFIALFVGSFYIYNTFSIVVAQRTKEMALLRAVGATTRQVLGSVLIEAFVVGVLASAVGLVMGVLMSTVLRAMLTAVGFDIPATGIVVLPGSMVTAFVVGMVITMVAAFFPARRASKVPPMAALRDVAVDRSSTSRIRIIAGGIVTALGAGLLLLGLSGNAPNAVAAVGAGAAITFIGIAVLGPVIARPVAGWLGSAVASVSGVSGRLARANAVRNPRRTSSTAAALMIGVGLVGCVMILAASLKGSFENTISKNFKADLVVDSGDFSGQSGLSPDLAERLRAIPDLPVVSEVRFAGVEVAGEPKFVLAVDPATIDDVVDMEVVGGSLRDLDDASVAVYEKTAADKGLKLGDTVTMKFPTGEKPLTVAALFKRQDFGGEYTIGLPAYDPNFERRLDYQIYTKVAPGADIAAVKSAIEAAAAPYPTAKVLDITEFKEASLAPFNQIVALVLVLLLLAIVIAVLGIINTLGLSILERTREIGLLRAVGMTRRQLRSTIRWESVIIALFGTLLGLAVGMFFGWAIVRALRDQGVESLTVPFGQLIVVTILAGIVGVLASVLPSRRASRLNILDAIDAE